MPMKRAMAIATLPALALALLTGCATVDERPNERIAQATLRLANGAPAGIATLIATGTGVDLSIAATGLSPGQRGAHLHTTGACEAPDFTTAGGHLNPDGRQHGTDNPAGSHMGDLPNLTVGDSGGGSVSVTLPGTREEVLARIFDGDGTAVIVHAGPDDYRTDPAGNSGARIACGVLTRG